MSQDAALLARAHTPRAIQALADVLDSDFSEPREVIAAANALLDRGHGKPSQAIIMAPGATNDDVTRKLAGMTDAELLIALGEARRARAALAPPIDSTAQVVPSGELEPVRAANSPGEATPVRPDRFLPHLLKRTELGPRYAREHEYPTTPADAAEFPDTDPLAL